MKTPFQRERHRIRSVVLSKLLCGYCDYRLPVYEFGCGDGFYLSEISGHLQGPCIGADDHRDPDGAIHRSIVYPLDLSHPLHLGPSGTVLCINLLERLSCERIPGLLQNLDHHCHSKMVITWSPPGQGSTSSISCKDEMEVLKILSLKGFRYDMDRSGVWRELVGKELHWFTKSIYIFERQE